MIIEIECKACNGDGYIEQQECDKPASICCGGCYVPKGCEECDSKGYYEVEVNIDNIRPFVESGEIESERV